MQDQATMTGEPIWQAEGQGKRQRVQAMFGQIAPVYDRLNGLMSLNSHDRWREAAVRVLKLKQGDRTLDVCCGTGSFFAPLRAAVGETGTIVGVDFCSPMLERAREKDVRAARALGDAGQLPIAHQSVDAVTVGWGIRNVPDIDAAHREIFRVLRSGGSFVSLDMATPPNPLVRSLWRFASTRLLPMIGGWFGQREAYTYLPESALRFWNREKLAQSMRDAGFQNVRYRDFAFGSICMHWGQKPKEGQ